MTKLLKSVTWWLDSKQVSKIGIGVSPDILFNWYRLPNLMFHVHPIFNSCTDHKLFSHATASLRHLIWNYEPCQPCVNSLCWKLKRAQKLSRVSLTRACSTVRRLRYLSVLLNIYFLKIDRDLKSKGIWILNGSRWIGSRCPKWLGHHINYH